MNETYVVFLSDSELKTLQRAGWSEDKIDELERTGAHIQEFVQLLGYNDAAEPA